MYKDGLGLEQSCQTCTAWHTLAAEQGDAGAQFTVGACYCNGRHGAVQADKVAREWWVKAGVQGDENARKGLRILDAATGKAAKVAQATLLVTGTCTGEDDVRCIVDDRHVGVVARDSDKYIFFKKTNTYYD